MLSAEEVTKRRHLWLALSELFLDTETRRSFPWIIRVALESGYSWDQIESIFWNEVAPAVSHNLFDVAGDWAGFPEEWLVDEITGILSSGPSLTSKLQRAAARQQLKPMLQGLRRMYQSYPSHLALLTEDDDQGEQVLLAMAKLFVEKNWSQSVGLWRHSKLLSNFSQVTLDRCWTDCIADSLEPLLSSDSKSDPKRSDLERNWQWLQEMRNAVQTATKTYGLSSQRCYEVCEQLDYLFSVPALANTPRGPMMQAELNKLLEGIPPKELRPVVWSLIEPMAKLYSDKNLARNWAELCRQQHWEI
jgi:hypothetical protein